MPKNETISKITTQIVNEAYDPFGWASDIQDAIMGTSAENGYVFVDGHGHLDIRHLVENVIQAYEKEQS